MRKWKKQLASLITKIMERLPGGDGILLDDVVAGIMGLVVLTAARFLVGDAAMWEVT